MTQETITTCDQCKKQIIAPSSMWTVTCTSFSPRYNIMHFCYKEFKDGDIIHWIDYTGDRDYRDSGMLISNMFGYHGKVYNVFPGRLDCFGIDDQFPFGYVDIYKSKNEALDAMIKNLQGMRDV